MQLLRFLLIVSFFLNDVRAFTQRRHFRVQTEPTRLRINHDVRGDIITESLTRLVDAVGQADRTSLTDNDEAEILALIQQLEDLKQESVAIDDNLKRFDKLLGLYEVSFTKTSQPNENPVGGKWTRTTGLAQKLFRTRRRSFQHILPTNSTGMGQIMLNEQSKGDIRQIVAEAINVVSLEALMGLLRVTVILRGDATPLSVQERTNTDVVIQPLTNLAVRAWFDAPRIIFGRRGRFLNLQFGPKSSVLLDTLFVNDRVRLGMGGRSGTRFVFVRCQAEDDPEANEFRQLLQLRPMKRYKPMLVFATIAVANIGSLLVSSGESVASQVVRGSVAGFSVLLTLAIGLSTGGIERDRNRYEIFSKPQPTSELVEAKGS